jgi:probable phosphoglycerate mutase
MELLIIRHALPVRRELLEGAADPQLSDDGRRQADLLARYLETERLDALYTSPMARAVETAEPLAARTGLEVQISPGVAEFDQHSSEYVPVEELKAANDPRWLAMLRGEWGGDESEAEFQARVLTAMNAIIADHGGQRVAVVCHGGIINGFLAHVLGLPAFSQMFFYPNYTSINRVVAASSGQRSIVTINETSHLRGSGLPMGIFQQG